MDVKESLNKLLQSEEFKHWEESHKDFFLSHAFTMSGTANDIWQFGFSNKDNEIFTFQMEDPIRIEEHSEMLRKPDSKVGEVDIAKAKVDLIDILDKIEALRKEKYAAHLPMKKIIILHNIDSKLIWNITIVTDSVKTLNFKVDAVSGEILDDKMISLFGQATGG